MPERLNATTLPSHFYVRSHCFIRKTRKRVVKYKNVLTFRQVNADVGYSDLFGVVVGSYSVTIAPIFKTVSVQNKTLDIVAASTFCAKSTNDIGSPISDSEGPVFSVSRLYRKSSVDDHGSPERVCDHR